MICAQEICRVAETAARAAGLLIREAFVAAAAGTALPVEEKHGHADIVTLIDREAEAAIGTILFEAVPRSALIGEEGGLRGHDAPEVIWHVDPIDGTSNFASGLPVFCVSIGAFGPDGSALAGVVYDPMRDEMFTACEGLLHLNGARVTPAARAHHDSAAELLTNLPREGRVPSAEEMAHLGELLARFRAVRRLGSAALQLAYVAVGRAAINADEGCNSWDIAAGLQLVAASGGQIFCWSAAEPPVLLSDPLRALDAIGRLIVATPGYDVAGSAVLGRGLTIPGIAV